MSESSQRLASSDQEVQRNAMAGAQRDNQNQAMSGLLRANGLDYSLPPSLSVVTKRNLIRNYFNKSSYGPNENMVCVLNGSDNYIYGPNSYLTFTVKNESGDNNLSVGSGSGINLMDRIVLTTESGTEVERIEKPNNFVNTNDRYQCSENWLTTIGNGTLGYDVDIAFGQKHTFCIPLNKISGLFAAKKLLPGLGLMSGLRVEINLEDKDTAFVWTSAPVSTDTYSISDPAIVTDSYQLSDSILKSLNAQSASRSLEIMFESYDRTPGNLSNGNTVLNMNTKRAVSRAQWAIAKTRITANASGAGRGQVDSFASEEFLVKEYQFQLGSLYFPNAPVRATNDNADKHEMYVNSMYVFDKLKDCQRPTSIDYDTFKSTHGLMGATLERSNILALAGLPVSGSRILQLRAEYTGAGVARTVDIYMSYVKLCRVFLDRSVIKE